MNVAKECNIPVLCSLHEVELALQVADRIVGFRYGVIAVDCPACEFTAREHTLVYGQGRVA